MGHRTRGCLTAIGVVFLFACGGDPGAPGSAQPDSGADSAFVDGGADGAFIVAAPVIPWLAEGAPPVAPVTLTPCPPGWREVTGGEVVECDPYPIGGAQVCEPGEAHFPGEASCRPVGDACPAGDYASALPSGEAILYVKAGALAGGDGSITAPYSALVEVGWNELTTGTTVALAKGRYPGNVLPRAGVHVIGACARETLLTGVPDSVTAVIHVASAGDPAVVRNVTVIDAPQRGVVVFSGRALMLAGAIIDGAREIGVYSHGTGSEAVLTDVVVRNTRPRVTDGAYGMGISAVRGARIEASRVVVAGNHYVGVRAEDAGSVITLDDAIVRDTDAHPRDATWGYGVVIQEGAHLEAARVVVEGNEELGLYVGGGTHVGLADVIVRDTHPRGTDGAGGMGIVVIGGAHLEASRLVVAGNHKTGLYAWAKGDEEGAVVQLFDVVVRDTESQASDDEGGQGLIMFEGVRFEAERLFVSNNRYAGVVVKGLTTEAALTDVVIQDTKSLPDGSAGRGITLTFGARLEASRSLVQRNRSIGILVGGGDAPVEMHLTDVAVRSTTAQASGGVSGRGFVVNGGSHLEGRRILVDENQQTGIYLREGSTTTLVDAVIRDTESNAESGTDGMGIVLTEGTRLEGQRLLLSRNRGVAVLVSGEGADATLTDVRVEDTRPQVFLDFGGRGLQAQSGAEVVGQRIEVHGSRETGVFAYGGSLIDLREVRITDTERGLCEASSCTVSPFGHGVVADAAEVRLEAFVVQGAATCGVMVANDEFLSETALLTLRAGEVSDSLIGACVQVDGYDFERLTDEVRYHDNGRNLETTMLPVPQPSLGGGA